MTTTTLTTTLTTTPCPPLVDFVTIEAQFTARCPVRNDVDWYTVAVMYRPIGACVETASLRAYLASLADTPILAEALAAELVELVMFSCAPEYARVELTREATDAIRLTVEASKHQKTVAQPWGENGETGHVSSPPAERIRAGSTPNYFKQWDSSLKPGGQ